MLDLLWQCLQALYEMFFRKIITFPHSNISAVLLSTDATHIGEGAFSLVLKAKDSNSTHNHTKYYALKRMLLQSTECHVIVKNEIEAFQRFQHEHIIPLLDYVESTEKGRLVMFLLLPYCAQGSLRTVLTTHLQQKGIIKFTLQEVLYQFQHICDALLVLHQYQPAYVHQDIKPDVSVLFKK